MDLEDSLSDETAKTLETSQTQNDPESPPPLLSISDCAAFTRRKGCYTLAKQYRLKNSLLAGVGLLELANAGDFAANVWNEVPVPHFAAVLMALGATLALSISYFAFKDATLSRRNIHVLREERRYLRTQKADHVQDVPIARDVQSQLDVNFREMGTELVDRIGMDIVMGFGAICVGIGTFLAIGGANHNVFLASNLLSGYIGNAPVALYGTVNAAWSAYVWRRAYRHGIAGAKELKGNIIERVLKRRLRRVKTHAAINGVTGTVAGAASLVTATMWYGYPILVPCIISSLFCNYIWRNKIGYDRRLIRQTLRIDRFSLIEELKSVTSVQKILKEEPSESFLKLVSDPKSIASTIEFIRNNDLFEDFCVRLLKDTSLSTSLFGTLDDELTIDPQSLLSADKIYLPRLLEIAQETVSEMGLIRFRYRERYLLETIGCYLCPRGVETTSEKC
ncbi:hypothetical protein BDZ45DRAFT_682418 [Acephala macrosclerotiorum]|nr:hypothetical protein BDZ45DRAFT_682418 [Acephala macrosclerotiorum]